MLYDIGYVLCGISTKAKTLLDFGEYECICIAIVEVELKLQRATKIIGAQSDGKMLKLQRACYHIKNLM